ncbi:sensor histidine kinase [Streptomyces sp. NPDC091383]|uniref:sensor histidine kinase n=1 Tax=Streptomyces sp. NPDC091383 TaxID=3365996 RepID=UPI0038094B2A
MRTATERPGANRLEKIGERRPFAVDLAAALALLACAAFGIWLNLPGQRPPDHDKAAVALMGTSCLALLGRRARPRLAVTVCAVCAAGTAALGYLLTPLLLAPLMGALYWLATRTGPRTTRRYGVATVLAVTLTAVLTDLSDPVTLPLQMFGPACWLALPLVAGTMARLRRAYLHAAQHRAEHAERTREEEARLRVAEERVRIARELHDVVAHHMALANAQAGTAAHLALSNPEQTRKILVGLTDTTSSALRELKATLGLLRQTDDPPGDSSLSPLPGLAQLPDLVEMCASAGLEVTVTTEGVPEPLSPGVDLTAYRIVQEALTNVAKHATAKTARVHLAHTGSRLSISVANDGPPRLRTPRDGGFGLLGMRERARSVGGDLTAGPRPRDGGYEVSATLPLSPPVRELPGETAA